MLNVLLDVVKQSHARGPAQGLSTRATGLVALTILRGIQGATVERDRAIIAVELHGFRAKEVRLLLRRNVVIGKPGLPGHFLIEDEAATKRGTAGVRHVPMDPAARGPLLEYLRVRPEGSCKPPVPGSRPGDGSEGNREQIQETPCPH